MIELPIHSHFIPILLDHDSGIKVLSIQPYDKNKHDKYKRMNLFISERLFAKIHDFLIAKNNLFDV